MRRSTCLSVLLVAVLSIISRPWTDRGQLLAQGGQPPAVVIEGGTLIDGNGGAPVRDVQIVIQGNTITSVGRKGQSHAANAQVINADGKFILPGLWDAQINWRWYHGEIFLNNGVTSFVGLGDNNEVSMVTADAVRRGKLRAPRIFDYIVHFQGPGGNLTGVESAYAVARGLGTPEEARVWTKRVLDVGSSAIVFQNGGSSVETFKASVDVAHAAGKSVGIRSGGPNILPKDAAMAGADFIPISTGVGLTVTTLPPPAPGAGAVNDLDRWAQIDEAKAADLIKVLVQSKTALIPNFLRSAPGLPKGWSRFEAQDRRLFADPSLMAYYPPARAQVILWNFLDPPNLAPDLVERRTRGFQNALRFHRMLIQAGGRVLIGSDGGQNAAPGLGVHQEMEVFAEDMGLPPMQVIQAATKWPAEALRMQNQLGTIEAGKLADVLIVNDDPLQSIANLHKIAWVIADGRIQDRVYHAWYRSPFGGDGPQEAPTVEDLAWAVNFKKQNGGGAVGGGGQTAPPAGFGAARQPQPTIETIDSGRKDFADADFSKGVVKEGGPTVNLKMTGFNYFQRSVVFFNDIPVPTKVLSRFEIEATIDESLLRTPGRYSVVVKNLGLADPANPALGDGTSNSGYLIVSYR